MWDISFSGCRMIMMGLYATGDIPFKVAHMHSRVLDAKGQKMSKSKGNVIDPVSIATVYGSDALRMALVYGVAPGSDIALSEDKIKAQRNFITKIWNASRFVLMLIDRLIQDDPDLKITTKLDKSKLTPADKAILKSLNGLIASTAGNLNKYRFGQASENLYQFFWHEFCDIYIEQAKGRGGDVVPFSDGPYRQFKILHPFMPFVTESVYQKSNFRA